MKDGKTEVNDRMRKVINVKKKRKKNECMCIFMEREQCFEVQRKKKKTIIIKQCSHVGLK